MYYPTIIKLAKTAALNDASNPPPAGLDWKAGLLGTPLVNIVKGLALNKYHKNVFNPFEYDTAGNLDPLLKLQKKTPWDVIPPSVTHDLNRNPMPENVKVTQILKRLARSKGVELASDISPAGYMYQPPASALTQPKITTGLNEAAGPIAHEIGHFNGPKKLMTRLNVIGGNLAGRLGTSFGTMGALFSSNEDNSRNAGLAGTAANIPILASEIDASIRGGSLLKRLGRSRAGAFIGLPTYGVMASSPIIAHYAKKLLGGFSKKVAPEGVLPQLD